MSSVNKTEIAIFAAGCFWGVEAAFRAVPGVIDVEVGYSGGKRENPSYEQVCSGGTGHAEAVRITFDNSQVTYEGLLKTFWQIHDPTTPNRQGPDIGTQYRSAIFVCTDQQRELAQKALDTHQQKLAKPIVTEVVAAQSFYRAEEYHQRYFEKNGIAYCPR